MSVHAKVATIPGSSMDGDFLGSYLETLAMVERLHRLLLDVVKDEFERLG
ncbi:MarR family transcriptional regulator, partial [Amaricoccus sp. HAR-UPW-R2A-40]